MSSIVFVVVVDDLIVGDPAERRGRRLPSHGRDLSHPSAPLPRSRQTARTRAASVPTELQGHVQPVLLSSRGGLPEGRHREPHQGTDMLLCICGVRCLCMLLFAMCGAYF